MTSRIARAELLGELRRRALEGPPLLLSGPPGSGKSALLGALDAALRDAGRRTLRLDLLLAASSPEGLARSIAEALPEGGDEPPAAALRALAASPGADREAVCEAWLRVLAELRSAGGRRVTLLLDEPTEMLALSTFSGLREIGARLGAALARRAAPAILATSFPTRSATFWKGDGLDIPRLSAAELEPYAGSAADALARASGGLVRYAAALLERVEAGESVARAWAVEMADGGRLDQECRSVYETLLLRSRGYGMSKAVLAAVAQEEGTNLTALTGRLGRSPGAVGDYLGWLLDVDVLRCEHKRYSFADPVLRDWLRLRAGGRSPDAEALERAAAEFGHAPASSAPPLRHDALMEID